MPTISAVDESYEPVLQGIQNRLGELTPYRGLDVALDSAIHGMSDATSRLTTVRDSFFTELDRVDVELRANVDGHAWREERDTSIAVFNATREGLVDDLKANRNLGELMAGKGARPKIDETDMALRDELRVLFGNATQEQIIDRMFDMATTGRRDIGALATAPYGKSVLLGRGMDDVDEVVRTMWEAMASTAAEHGLTEKERQYGRAYQAFKIAGSKVVGGSLSYLSAVSEAASWNGSRRADADRARAAMNAARVANARGR